MESTKEVLIRDSVVLVMGKLDFTRGGAKIVADKIQIIPREDALGYTLRGETIEPKAKKGNKRPTAQVPHRPKSDEAKTHKVYIRLEDSSDQEMLMSLKEKLDGYSGKNEVILVTGPKDDKKAIRLPQSIEVNEESIRELADIFGSTNVVVR
jgi:hypothetical protein